MSTDTISQKLTDSMVDIESQSGADENLKGILIKPHDKLEYQNRVVKNLLECCIALCVIIVTVPIATSDLYFGFSDSSCSREEPDDISITVRLYLLVSGFMLLTAMTLFLIGLYSFDEITFVNVIKKIDKLTCCFISCGSIGVILFVVIWNVLGAIVFWEYIRDNGNCNKTFSTYVSVSLIIKFVGTLYAIVLTTKYKKEEIN